MSVNFKLLRTDTANKRPTAAQLSIGELGLNYDADTPGLFFEDDEGGVRKLGPMEVSSSAPNASAAGSSGNSKGELWLDNSSGHVLKYYTGSSWTAITNTGEAGSNTQVIFNDGGSYSGDSTFTFNKTSNVLSVAEVESKLDGPVIFEAKAASALSRGDVLFVSSIDSGVPVVKKADADDATKRPAVGVCDTVASASGDTVNVIVSGYIENIDTDTVGYTLNDELFLGTTVGQLTNTAPTGESSIVQHVGTVVKVDSSSGIINVNVSGVAKTPNLNNGNIFVGNGSNQAVADAFTDVLNDQAGISSAASAVAMTIDSSGNVGIGTSSTSDGQLCINGGANGSSVLSGRSDGGSGNNARFKITAFADGGGAGYGGGIGFQTRSTTNVFSEALRINSSGKVGIGTTGSQSAERLQVRTSNDTQNQGYAIATQTETVNSNFHMRFINPNGAVGSITTAASATAFNTSSDYRLKENIVDIADGITRVKQLSPKRFNFIADDTTVVDGFIAHEAQTVVPEAITGEKDATKEEEYEVTPAVLNDDGEEVTPAVMGTRTVPDYQGIDQSKLVPLLTAALQEAITKIETLEQRLFDAGIA